MNIAGLLEELVAERADQPAIIESRKGRERSLTFKELHRVSAGIACNLAERGVQCGDRVLLLAPVSVHLYAALLGVLHLGAVAMVVEPSAGIGGLRRCCRRVPPRAVVGSLAGRVLARVLPELRSTVKVDLTPTRAADRPQSEPRQSSDPALLTFTSGSTGEPKAVVRSHGLLMAQNRALASVLDQAPGETCLATLPIFVLAHLAAGATSILADANLARPGFIDPAPVLEQIRRHRPVTTVASPSLLLRLADEVDRVQMADLCFRRIFTGGAPVFPDMVDRIGGLAPSGRVSVLYGSTEAEPISHMNSVSPDAMDRIAKGSGLPVGVPVRDVQLKVIHDSWGIPLTSPSQQELEAMALPPGRTGEIIVSGEHVVPGYLDGVGDESTKMNVEGKIWHRTGDGGYLTEEGELWLVGRCSAAVSMGDGQKVYPIAVEAAARAVTGRRTALMKAEGAPTLLIGTGGSPVPDSDTTAIRAALKWVDGLRLVGVNRIPFDSRHNAKVDYTRLGRQRPVGLSNA